MAVIGKLWANRNTLVTFLTPLLLLPLPLFSRTPEAACGFTLLVTAVYWISEAVPLATAAMVPAFLFPMFDIMKSSQVAAEYFKDIHLLLFGVVCLSAAIQKWNLHRRIALRMVMVVGANPSWLMLGFMSGTAFLSMWLSNTSTAAMVMPIIEAVLHQLIHCQSKIGTAEEDCLKGSAALENRDNEEKNSLQLHVMPLRRNDFIHYCYVSTDDNDQIENLSHQDVSSLKDNSGDCTKSERNHLICKALSLCIAYSSTIGGLTTITGTSTNLIFAEQFHMRYPGCQYVNFGSWFLFSFPVALIILLLSWIWLHWLFLGFDLEELFGICKKRHRKQEVLKNVIKEEYEKLGPMSYQEAVTLTVLILMALSWFTRDPGFFPGWASGFGLKGYKTDATSATLLGFLLFAIPAGKPKIFSCFSARNTDQESEQEVKDFGLRSMIIWQEFEQSMPWQISILVGGGFALAKGCEVSGLSVWIGSKLEPLSNLPTWAIILLSCLLVTSITEVVSNPATITIFLPILSSLAEAIGTNPLYILLPVTFSTSCAFLLPAANPPNAIVFSYGHLRVMDMVKAGLGVNVISIVTIMVALFTWGIPIFSLETYPQWAPLRNNSLVLTNSTLP
ncbi:solute carrier family 13 member 1-like [Heptranchias perlo]|uniref:solute carrier family 13 member 1-like n=1 Tax=Heptranchias perlo TaxID=212740 RepID=UPI00355A6255